MSNHVQVLVRKRNLGSPTRKAVALRMADAASDDGRGIWVSVERMSLETEFSERSVQRCIQQFLDEGLLVMVRAATGTVGIANQYDMALERLSIYPEIKLKSRGHRPKKAASTGDRVSPVESSRGDTVSNRGDTVSSQGCQGVTRTTVEPPIEPPFERDARKRVDFPEYEKPDTAKLDAGETPKALERRFAEFLEHWSKVKGLPKGKWWKAWIALSPEERVSAEQRCKAWHLMLKRQGRDYPPMPSTYLEEKLWQDVDDDALAKAEKPTKAEQGRAAPFGPVWGAKRMALLLQGPANLPDRHELRDLFTAKFGVFQRGGGGAALRYAERCGVTVRTDGSLEFPDDFEERELARRTLEGFPGVNALDRAARDRKFEAVEPEYASLSELMEPVPVDCEMWRRWEDWHAENNLPFVPETGNQRVVYFPKGGPKAIDTFARTTGARINQTAGEAACS